jgi:hypothetical protein
LWATVHLSLAQGSNPSYLNTEELLELYQSMYSRIRNVHVSYTNMLVKTQGLSPELSNLTRFKTTERIEEGQKYYVRSSGDPNGFADPVHIGESAFDGSVTTDYLPHLKAGRIIPGRTGYSAEVSDMLWAYMLIAQTQPYRNPERISLNRYISSQSSVRAHLEEVSGEWCHVVDTFRNEPTPHATIWFAGEKGGLPMKLEEYKGGKCIHRIVVGTVGSADTDTGPVWYPQEATNEHDDNDGYIRYEFRVSSLRANFKTTRENFTVSFPPGTNIIDKLAGIYYTTGLFDEKKRFGALDGYGLSSGEPKTITNVSPAIKSRPATTNVQTPAAGPAPNEPQLPLSGTAAGQPQPHGSLIKTILCGLAIVVLCIMALLLYRLCAVRKVK